jgi:hypothetical protein
LSMDFDQQQQPPQPRPTKVHQTSNAPLLNYPKKIQIFWFGFGVVHLSRIAPARRRKAAVKTGSKLTVTSTHTLPDSTIFIYR